MFTPLNRLCVSTLTCAHPCTYVRTYNIWSPELWEVWSGGGAAFAQPTASALGGPEDRSSEVAGGLLQGWTAAPRMLNSRAEPTSTFVLLSHPGRDGRLGSGVENRNRACWEKVADRVQRHWFMAAHKCSRWSLKGGTKRTLVPPLSECQAKDKRPGGARVPSVLERPHVWTPGPASLGLSSIVP